MTGHSWEKQALQLQGSACSIWCFFKHFFKIINLKGRVTERGEKGGTELVFTCSLPPKPAKTRAGLVLSRSEELLPGLTHRCSSPSLPLPLLNEAQLARSWINKKQPGLAQAPIWHACEIGSGFTCYITAPDPLSCIKYYYVILVPYKIFKKTCQNIPWTIFWKLLIIFHSFLKYRPNDDMCIYKMNFGQHSEFCIVEYRVNHFIKLIGHGR